MCVYVWSESAYGRWLLSADLLLLVGGEVVAVMVSGRSLHLVRHLRVPLQLFPRLRETLFFENYSNFIDIIIV